MHIKFTDRSVQNLKSKEQRYIVWKDGGEGLGLRVSPKGKKTFVYMYRYDGISRMMTLGDYPRTSLADANLQHSSAAKLLREGSDPGKEKVEERKTERNAETVADLAHEYIEKWAKPRKRTWRKDDLILKKDILSEWGRKKAKDITRRDVVLLLDKILKRNAPIQANRTLAAIRKMYNFGLGRDIVQHNPCLGIVAPSAEQQRDRVLSEEEIKTFWQNLSTTSMDANTRNAFRLALLTGQRIGEVVSSRWQDMDLKNGWWVIPAAKAKNELQHRVALSPESLRLIEDIKRCATGRDNETYLFPSPREGKHINVTAMSHALRRNISKWGVENFTTHDLRRTAASHMTGMGISRLIVSKILNHVEPHITAVYDRYSYDAEKQHALNAWGKRLMEIVEGKSKPVRVVVPLRKVK